MATLNLQREFISNIIDVHGQIGEDWLNNLPNLISHRENMWRIKLAEPFDNLTYSFVGIVKSGAGKAVLKLAPPHPQTNREIAWYNHQQTGCAKLLKSDPKNGAMLLELLTPATPTKQLVIDGKDDEATRGIAETILALGQPAAPKENIFTHVRELRKDLILLQGKIKNDLYKRALDLFDQLTNLNQADCLLHGDLHHANVLSAGAAYKAIDPHGYVGPAAFETGAMLRNPRDCFPEGRSVEETLSRRLEILDAMLPFEFKEICGWGLVYTLISCSWSLQNHNEQPKTYLDVSGILSKFLDK